MDSYTHYKRKKPKPDPKRRCHRCHGSGQSSCISCGGQGRVVKTKDHLGQPIFGRCDACYGTRTRRCTSCSGEGFI